MPYETRLVDEGRGVLRIGSGIVTTSELLEASAKLAMNEAVARNIKYLLADFSEVTDLRLTPNTIHYVAELNRKAAQFSSGAFVAIVAPSPLAYGLGRMWQMLMEEVRWTSAVFHQRAEAIVWLKQQLGQGEGKTLEHFPYLREESRQLLGSGRLPVVHEKIEEGLPESARQTC